MNPTTEPYLTQYQARADTLPGRRVNWLQAQRRAGLARFTQVGFPTQRDEDWRYTTVKPITVKKFHGLNAAAESAEHVDLQAALDAMQIKGLQSHRLVFVDGVFAAQWSHSQSALGVPSEGVTVAPLAQVLEQNPHWIEQAFGSVKPDKAHGFTALNNAYSQDGVVVLLAENARPTTPVEMLFVSCAPNGCAQPRNIVIAGAASKVQLIERYVSVNGKPARDKNSAAACTFTNSSTEIVVGETAEVDYYLVQTQSQAAYHVCGVWAQQARGSRFSCRTITLGGALVRNDLGVELAGEQAHCDMFGLYHLSGAQHVDNHTTMLHCAENCSSREWYKGVLEQRSRAVFHGRIKVAPGAQKTNAAQTNNNLLLSAHAEIDSKPQLEIYADDVQCSHGATVGQLDADALFYLRARGLDEAAAGEMLRVAFVNDVLNQIAIDELKQTLETMLAARLTGNRLSSHP